MAGRNFCHNSFHCISFGVGHIRRVLRCKGDERVLSRPDRVHGFRREFGFDTASVRSSKDVAVFVARDTGKEKTSPTRQAADSGPR